MNAKPRSLTAHPSSPLIGTAKVPGDKSISHRSLLFGALAVGTTKINGLLESTDIIATANALRTMGVPIEKNHDHWIVTGRAIGGLLKPSIDLDFGNAGTGVRLMMGVLAGQDFSARLVGDSSLSKRPMGRVLKPLKQMGLVLDSTNDDRLPLIVHGTSDLLPISYELPVPSAQVKSAVLLAGLHAPGETTVIENETTRDHTERMLDFFGADLTMRDINGKRHITLKGEAILMGRDISVPGDPSSAAFLAAAAAIIPKSDILLKNILLNPTRSGFFETLKEMGADISFEERRAEAGEELANIRVKHAELTGVTIPAERAPSMIDEYPVLAAVAAFAQGTTRMEGLDELRVKESDRLAATSAGLETCGVDHEIAGDCLEVHGSGEVRGGGTITTHMDHRIAMSFLTLGLGAKSPVHIDDGTMIATSFPSFVPLMQSLGAKITKREAAPI